MSTQILQFIIMLAPCRATDAHSGTTPSHSRPVPDTSRANARRRRGRRRRGWLLNARVVLYQLMQRLQVAPHQLLHLCLCCNFHLRKRASPPMGCKLVS